MVEAIRALDLDVDVLFIDDDSPDGTGPLLEGMRAGYPRLSVLHRSGKKGIGSAHMDGIAYAYAAGYERLVTLDCDFSHNPEDIPRFLRHAESADVVVGSRWAARNSLPEWNVYRRMMTGIGHFLTRAVLGLPYDATSAFRAYRLDRILENTFSLAHSKGYSFFFESLFILHKNAFDIREIPIVLPARTYGHSKMTIRAASQSVRTMLGIAATYRRRPSAFHTVAPPLAIDPRLHDPQHWDQYWKHSRGAERSRRVYAIIASLYRRTFIRPRLQRVLRRTFRRGSHLLHAGCGGGEVDRRLHERMRITALDISADALRLYQTNNPAVYGLRHGDILALPYAASSFDGYYSLGVVEHFTEPQILRILSEALRVVRHGGKVVLFWPHARATSVRVLGLAHRLMTRMGNTTELHPAEVSLLTSRAMAERYLNLSGFRMTSYDFGAKDLWIQAVIVAERTA